MTQGPLTASTQTHAIKAAHGYDEQHIYLVDSLAENANASDTQYNRVLPTEDFEAVWKTGTLLPDNIYITLEM